MDKFPSAQELLDQAKKINPRADINQLHALTYNLMMKYKDVYYQDKVKDFLSRPSFSKITNEMKLKIGKELLKPVQGGEKLYSNFMEEASRRISQSFQPISGNLAELCVEKELIDVKLKPNINYTRKKEHTDFILYYPEISNVAKKHRIEVKNVKLRERATRGFEFDGDSMLGFFDDSAEFTDSNINIIEKHCKKTGGYCYIPPEILSEIKNRVKGKRFKSNKEFILDAIKFIKTGII